MELKVRRALPKDGDAVSDLLYQVAGVHHVGRPDIFKPASKKYTQAEFEELIFTKDHAVLVAEDDSGKIHGYAFCNVRNFESSVIHSYKALYVDDICVDENSRGKHVGTVIFEAVKALASEWNCQRIELNVWEFNETALRFYEKMGMTTQRRFMELEVNE